MNKSFSLEQFLKQEKFECRPGLEPESLSVQLSVFTFRPPALLLTTAV